MFQRMAVVCLLVTTVCASAQETNVDIRFQQGHDFLAAGNYRAARDAYGEVWKECERTRGPNDSFTLDARILYGQLLTMTGRPDQGLTVLGPIASGHARSNMIARGSFALALRASGQLDRATELLVDLTKAFPINEPLDRVHLGRMHTELAVTLAFLHRFREAESHAREALRQLDQSGQPPSAHRASINTILGQIYILSGRERDAREVLSRAREEALPFWNKNHPELAILEGALGLLAFRSGRYDEAEQRTRAALAATENLLGGRHPEAGAIAKQLAQILKKQKKKQEAAEWEARSRAILGRPDAPASVSAWSWRELK